MKGKGNILILLLLLLCCLPVSSQDATYIHDDIKCNQITAMEQGFGSLDDFWHWSLHHSYSKDATASNKMLFRGTAMEANKLQVEKSNSIKSDFKDRAVVEGKNLIDRNLDIVWQTERSRLESSLLKFKKNYDNFCFYGPSTDEREYWKEKYDRFDWAINVIRKGYIPNSERKKAYVQLKEDIDAANKKLVACSYVLYVKGEIARMNVNRKPRLRTVEVIAKKSQNDWYGNLTRSGKKQ